jgi:hypothetical protein
MITSMNVAVKSHTLNVSLPGMQATQMHISLKGPQVRQMTISLKGTQGSQGPPGLTIALLSSDNW